MSQKTTLSFQTEVKQLLNLMIHSLYSNKEIFLRELISNASDAADKLRFLSLKQSELLGSDTTFAIHIDVDAKAKTISIRDNGIGMSHDEVIANLGTIAKSGTKAFVEALSQKEVKDANLIGQFGVGFYSAFMVAEKVTVKTRRADVDAAHGVIWESSGEGDYTVEKATLEARGSEIILHLKPDAAEFLEPMRLRTIIRRYSDHIAIPIYMKKPDKDEYEQVNHAKALWARPKNEISAEDYNEFYRHVAHDFQEPLLHLHYKVEGKQDYTALLFIPKQPPFDLWNREQKSGLKLYVERVFIMDNADILPNYLRFVKGVIDSNDLPLNVSREILQRNETIEKIRSGVTKKILGTLEKLSEDKEKYQGFWEAFGKVLKEGVVEDASQQKDIAKLLRFASTHNDDATQNVSLDEYIARMQKSDQPIYYIIADHYLAAKNSPHLESFKQQGIEVLLLTDRVDEWLMGYLTEYAGKKFQSVSKSSAASADKKEEEAEKELEPILKQMQEVLKDKVKAVRFSTQLVESPSVLVAGDEHMTLHMQRLMKEAGQMMMPMSAPILEINPTHPIIEQMKTEADEDRFADFTKLLFEEAMLTEGLQLDDPAGFVKRVNQYLK